MFATRISDPDTKPAVKAGLLYLLSAEAQRKNELDDYYAKQSALSGSNLTAALLSERVITTLRTELHAQTGHRPGKEEPDRTHRTCRLRGGPRLRRREAGQESQQTEVSRAHD